MTKPFISSAVIHLNRECRLLVNFEGENGNFRFEMVNNKLYNSLQGKIKWIWISRKWFSSVQFSRSVVSDSLRPHELQYARPPCPSPIPRVHSDSRPLSQWCHPTLLSSVIPFSSCLQSFPASGSFPRSWLFTSVGPSIGVSDSASVFLVNI